MKMTVEVKSEILTVSVLFIILEKRSSCKVVFTVDVHFKIYSKTPPNVNPALILVKGGGGACACNQKDYFVSDLRGL